MSADPHSVGSLFALAQSLGLARLDAQLLIAHALERARTWVIAHPEATIDDPDAVATAMRRRASGEPLAYLIGRKAFHGLDLDVDARVLVPRAETESLVDWAIELLDGPLGLMPSARVLDLGTGSGAIALALKAARPRIDATAVDSSEAALQVARANATRLGLSVTFANGDWWHALHSIGRCLRFDLIVANPPYIRDGDPHLSSLSSEPRSALVSGPDGLEAMRTIVGGVAAHLTSGGWLLVEHGHDQADQVARLMAAHGLRDVEQRLDLGEIVRCCGGRSPTYQRRSL